MRTPTVLVVEADPSIRALISDVLCGEGYRVQLQEQGLLNTCDIAAAQPDLLLLEIRPGNVEHTLAWLEEVKRQPATAGQQVLVSTTDPRLLECHGAALRRLGCATVLKPFDLDDFTGAVSQHIAIAA